MPLAIKGTLTYSIPGEMQERIMPGSRVLVGLGKSRLYTGIVAEIRESCGSEGDKIKDIIRLLDETPLVRPQHIEFWKWMADYYICSPGEVLRAALPSGFLPEGEISGKTLSLNEKYNPREDAFVILSSKYSNHELNSLIDNLARAPKQQKLLLDYLRLTDYSPGKDLVPVKRSDLLKESGALIHSLHGLTGKGILVNINLEISRLKESVEEIQPLKSLSQAQKRAISDIQEGMKNNKIVLLHGVTSSGKTELYIHLIEEQLKAGKQVLYLLPEIALTTQIIKRLKRHFGNSTCVYHSRFSDAEQVEIWKKVADISGNDSFRLILGARSALFLPFSNLGLVIIDEEHDSSYKQSDPAPRYNARDSAIMLASMTGTPVVLGSATPSLETYYNAVSGKYSLVEIKERYGNINMPEIVLANTREAGRKKLMTSHFSPQLLIAIDSALQYSEQVILFRNRRGFSSFIECSECGWVPSCKNCSVNLTYHKEINRLTCHYCGYAEQVPVKCNNCGNISMSTVGYGTEKIEDEIKIIFPRARVARIDQDSTRSKNAFRKIITSFETGQTDILIGTQMISKGLDFENITVVGILNADSLLNFPDFRAHERAFQMMSQVSGRAGRRLKHGRVIIQTSDPDNMVIRQVLNNDFRGMFKTQMEERRIFNYPPFCRMIRISLKHKDKSALNDFAELLGVRLRDAFGKRVLGPEFPLISRIQFWYIKHILIKIEKDKSLVKARHMIMENVEYIEKLKGAGSLRINIDVDPY